ncbi:hypothetical protein NP118_23195 [Salmonella enterica]|nr:hypothetical protein [Salmonella enterica]
MPAERKAKATKENVRKRKSVEKEFLLAQKKKSLGVKRATCGVIS